MILALVIVLGLSTASAQIPVSSESMQLQELITKSTEQIKSLKEILEYSKRDSNSLDRASHVLEQMSQGINQSIAKFQGTEVYQKALLKLQTDNNFAHGYSDSESIKDHEPKDKPDLQELSDKNFKDSVEFQKETVKANTADALNESNLEQALLTAQQGFIPKIQAQAQIGNWQANTRLSTQMTELLAATHAVREELRASRLKNQNSTALNKLVYGSELQNLKRDGKFK